MKLLNTEKREPKRNRTCIRLLDIRASATLSALHLSNVRAPLNATVRLRLRNVRAPLNATVRLRPRNVRAEKPAVSNPVLRVKTVHKRRVKGTYCIPLPHRSCCVVFTAKFEYDCPLFFFSQSLFHTMNRAANRAETGQAAWVAQVSVLKGLICTARPK